MRCVGNQIRVMVVELHKANTSTIYSFPNCVNKPSKIPTYINKLLSKILSKHCFHGKRSKQTLHLYA